jgi:uncharacterized membrane protein YbhN (UPF0104 family)
LLAVVEDHPAKVAATSAMMGFSPLVISGNLPAMGLKQILQDFSWETWHFLTQTDLGAILLASLLMGLTYAVLRLFDPR